MDRKREYQADETHDDESKYEIPEKRARGTVRVAMPIPEHCVGLVIGRHGSEITNISQTSSCHIQVSTDKSTPGWRMVEMNGLPGEIEVAKHMINAVVAKGTVPVPRDTEMGQMAPMAPMAPMAQRITAEMWIPANKCGRVIGKGGETMRRLRSDYNCMVWLVQDFGNQDNNPKPLKITGPPEDVERVKRTVQLLIDMCDVNPVNPSGQTSTVQLKVPRQTVGAIMGVRGTNIMRMSRETGCKIQFMTEDDAMIQERIMIVVGHPNCVNIAVQAIKTIVDANTVDNGGKKTIYCITVPASKCGLVIGRGGESIKQINAESGAHCELSRDPNQKPHEKTFVIKGTEQQVEHAKHLICIRVGDIPATTPFNPLAQQLQMAYQSQLIASSYQTMMLQAALYQPYQPLLRPNLFPTPSPSPVVPVTPPVQTAGTSSSCPTDTVESSDEWMQYYFPGYSGDKKNESPSY